MVLNRFKTIELMAFRLPWYTWYYLRYLLFVQIIKWHLVLLHESKTYRISLTQMPHLAIRRAAIPVYLKKCSGWVGSKVWGNAAWAPWNEQFEAWKMSFLWGKGLRLHVQIVISGEWAFFPSSWNIIPGKKNPRVPCVETNQPVPLNKKQVIKENNTAQGNPYHPTANQRLEP